MGKDKDSGKGALLPSTTRGGKDLPTMSNFSPNATTAAPKVTSTALPSSPLSRPSIITEIESPEKEYEADIESEGNLSKFLENTIEKVLAKNQTKTRASTSDSPMSTREAELAYSRIFMSIDSNDLEGLDAFVRTPLAEMFKIASNYCEPAIYVRDEAYDFFVDPEMIKIVEKNKFYGKEEEFLAKHLTNLMKIAMLLGKDEIHQHYYFLKLFPFSLGGDAKDWYNSLPPKSISSKDE